MLNVEMVCDLTSTAGYAAHSRLVVDALRDQGLLGKDIKLRVVNRMKQQQAPFSAEEGQFLKELTQTELERVDVRFFLEPAQFFTFRDKAPVVSYVHWETTLLGNVEGSVLPRQNLVANLNRCSQVLVGGASVKEAFVRSGVHQGLIRCVPGPLPPPPAGPQEVAINGLNWEAGAKVEKANRPLVVGYVAQWTPRKNIEAFLQDTALAFKKDEAVILLKTYVQGQPHEAVMQRCQEIRDMVRKESVPRLIVLTETLSNLQMKHLFNSIDVYYAPSRGEGFAIPLAMAVAADCLPLVSAYGAPADWLPEHLLLGGQMAPALGTGAYSYDQFWFDINRAKSIASLAELASVPREEIAARGRDARQFAFERAGAPTFVKGLVSALERAASVGV